MFKRHRITRSVLSRSLTCVVNVRTGFQNVINIFRDKKEVIDSLKIVISRDIGNFGVDKNPMTHERNQI